MTNSIWTCILRKSSALADGRQSDRQNRVLDFNFFGAYSSMDCTQPSSYKIKSDQYPTTQLILWRLEFIFFFFFFKFLGIYGVIILQSPPSARFQPSLAEPDVLHIAIGFYSYPAAHTKVPRNFL